MATLQPVKANGDQRRAPTENKTGDPVGDVAKQHIRPHSTRGRGFHAVEIHSLPLPEFISLIHDAARDGRLPLVISLLKSHLAPRSQLRLPSEDQIGLLEELAAVKDSYSAIELLLTSPQFPAIPQDRGIEIADSAVKAGNWDVLILLLKLDSFQQIPSFVLVPLRKTMGERLIKAAVSIELEELGAVLDKCKANKLLYPNDLGQALKALCEAGCLEGVTLILQCNQKDEIPAADSAEALSILSSKAPSTSRDAVPVNGTSTFSRRDPVLAAIRLIPNPDAAAIGKAIVMATEKRSLPLVRYFLLQAGNNVPPAAQGICLRIGAKTNDPEMFNLFVYADFLKTATLQDLGDVVNCALDGGAIDAAKQVLSSERLAQTNDLTPFLKTVHPQKAILALETQPEQLGTPAVQILFLAALREGLIIADDQIQKMPLPSILSGIRFSLVEGRADMAMHLLKKREAEMDRPTLEALFLFAIDNCSSKIESPNWSNTGFIKYIVLSTWYEIGTISKPALIQAFQKVAEMGLAKVFEILEKTNRFEELASEYVLNFRITVARGHAGLIKVFLSCPHSQLIPPDSLFEELLKAAKAGISSSVDAILEAQPNFSVVRILQPILAVGDKGDEAVVVDPFQGETPHFEAMALRIIEIPRFKDLFTNQSDLGKLKKGAERLKMIQLATALQEKGPSCILS
ncbi:MAG: hypothetical protein K1X28_08035 [Parachlamydiales bacterium]|nr:hypothetical protein [Parachlamydiales bacterium]